MTKEEFIKKYKNIIEYELDLEEFEKDLDSIYECGYKNGYNDGYCDGLEDGY